MEFVAKNFHNLEIFSLARNSLKIIDESFSLFIDSFAHSLTRLDLFYSDITDNGYKLLKKCKNLTHLTIWQSYYVTIEGLLSLKEIRNLQVISFYAYVKREDFQSLFKDEWLGIRRFLVISCLNFDDSCVDSVIKSCPNVRMVRISDCRRVTEEKLESLISECSALDTLHLSYMDITGNCLKAISKTSRLMNIDVRHCPMCAVDKTNT